MKGEPRSKAIKRIEGETDGFSPFLLPSQRASVARVVKHFLDAERMSDGFDGSRPPANDGPN